MKSVTESYSRDIDSTTSSKSTTLFYGDYIEMIVYNNGESSTGDNKGSSSKNDTTMLVKTKETNPLVQFKTQALG